MPLTVSPITIEGGCNCSAIRYRVTIPAEAKRPTFIAGGANVEPPIRAPVIATDHCNDCRTATGAIINHWFLAPLAMCFVSFVKKDDTVPTELKLGKDYPRGPWKPAREPFTASDPNPDDYLAFFRSSKGRRRYFCSRCGTQFGYNVHPTPDDWPGVEFLDLILGTIDREYLQGDNLTPERQCWWDVGIAWVQHQSLRGLHVPRHPGAWVDKIVHDDEWDSSDRLRRMAAIGFTVR